MTAALRTVEVQICGEGDELLAIVRAFDSYTAEITLKERTHNAESWAELSARVAQAVSMLGLETT